MEKSISSLAFGGSIAEAIVEAKRQKKLFVVYVSGDDPESSHLETSTWTDSRVAESISKYCILLHISEGSTDAAHFSAIYPQKYVPCITAIGCNGVQLWQSDGFVSGEYLISNFEKAWLSLHIQETTATFLSAALASKKPEVPTGASDTASFDRGSSSRTDIASSSKEKLVDCSEARPLVNSEYAIDETRSKLGDEVSPESVIACESESKEVEHSASSTTTAKEQLNPVNTTLTTSAAGCASSIVEGGFPAPEENLNGANDDSGANMETSKVIADEATEAVQDRKVETVEVEKVEGSDSSCGKSSDVHINIRLLDGASLQEKFSATTTLRMIKDYVDENQASSVGSYDLAIPYPRQVFNDQDLSKTLSELGLFNRQALIVVPHKQAVGHHKLSNSQKNSIYDDSSSNGSNEGYVASMKRILSYMNPFSYLGSGASSSTSAQESEYGPNSALQNRSNESTPPTGGNHIKSRQQISSGFGSNIHTLKHDDDDDNRFSDRNTFWNGNSTQYGGDNDGK